MRAEGSCGHELSQFAICVGDVVHHRFLGHDEGIESLRVIGRGEIVGGDGFDLKIWSL